MSSIRLTIGMEEDTHTFCLSLNRCCALRFFSDHACDLLFAAAATFFGEACKLVAVGMATG